MLCSGNPIAPSSAVCVNAQCAKAVVLPYFLTTRPYLSWPDRAKFRPRRCGSHISSLSEVSGILSRSDGESVSSVGTAQALMSRYSSPSCDAPGSALCDLAFCFDGACHRSENARHDVAWCVYVLRDLRHVECEDETFRERDTRYGPCRAYVRAHRRTSFPFFASSDCSFSASCLTC